MLVRVDPDVRARLERDRKDSGAKSLSAEVERQLKDAIRDAPASDEQTKTLCYLIMQLAQIAQLSERLPGAANFNWRNDRFDFEAFKYAINQLLDRLAPSGEVKASRYPQEETPQELGRHILSLVITLLNADNASLYRLSEQLGGGRGSIWYAFPQAAKALGISTSDTGEQSK
jgi:hypothetical protein